MQVLTGDSPTTRKVNMIFFRVLRAARAVAREMHKSQNDGDNDTYTHQVFGAAEPLLLGRLLQVVRRE